MEELAAEIERLATDQAQTHAEMVEARKANARLTAMVEQEKMLRVVMENSRSWQFTKPLRALFQIFRGGARD